MRSEEILQPSLMPESRWLRLAGLAAAPRTLALVEATAAAACNFAVSIVAARSFDAAHFAGYVTALSATFIAIAFLRVVFVTPTTIRADWWYARRLPALTAIHFSSIFILTVTVTAIMLVFALALGSGLWKAAAIAAPGVSLWFMGVEFERAMLIKMKRARSLPWMIAAQVGALAVLLPATLAHLITFPVFIAALALIGATKTLIAFAGAGRPHWKNGFSRLRAGLRKTGPSGLAYLAGSVACSHAPVFALALLSTPVAAGAFGAMRSLYQPMQVIFRSRDVVNQTRFHSDRKAAAHPLMKQFQLALFRTGWMSMLLAAALALAGPWLVHAAYGGRFDEHMTTYWLWGLIMVMINLVAISDAFISHTRQQNKYAVAQLLAGACAVALSLILAPAFADVGAAMAAIAGWAIIIIGALVVVRRTGQKPVASA